MAVNMIGCSSSAEETVQEEYVREEGEEAVEEPIIIEFWYPNNVMFKGHLL